MAGSQEPPSDGATLVVARAVAMREEARLARERGRAMLIANDAMRERIRARRSRGSDHTGPGPSAESSPQAAL
jgi:hypothetical protein